MTIKQQGGIFGRNPTFNDLTVEGTLSGADTSLDGSVTINESAANKDFRVEGTTDNYLIYADADQQSVGIGISNPNSYAFNDPVKLAVGNTAGSTTLSIVSNPSSFGYLAFADGTSGASRYAGRIEYQHSTGSMYFYVNDGSQNISITSSGNLAFPSGNGIDFSATSGTGTSELFDDYEEGTWTPAITFSGGDGTGSWSYTTQTGQYTKIGNTVRAAFQIRLSAFTKGTASGTPRISGLPFNFAVELCTGNIGLFNASFSSQPIIVGVTGTAQMDMLRIQDNNVWAALNDPDADAQYFGVIVYQTS